MQPGWPVAVSLHRPAWFFSLAGNEILMLSIPSKLTHLSTIHFEPKSEIHSPVLPECGTDGSHSGPWTIEKHFGRVPPGSAGYEDCGESIQASAAL